MEQDFELKHRLVGAAVLIFFGVLVLPWWLSPPEEPVVVDLSDTDVVLDSSTLDLAVSPDSLGPDLLAALAAEQEGTDEGEEEIYVSRITPLDQGGANKSQTSTAETKQSSQADVATAQTNKATQAPVKEKPSTAVKSAPKESAKAPPAKTPAAKTAVVKAPVTTQDATSAKKSVDVGWAVQVGVFTDRVGAGKVVDDLKAKGFNPKTSVVDTNKGPKTGTRVWLGPFEARVDAAKAKTSLTAKTGEPGFIRSFP